LLPNIPVHQPDPQQGCLKQRQIPSDLDAETAQLGLFLEFGD